MQDVAFLQGQAKLDVIKRFYFFHSICRDHIEFNGISANSSSYTFITFEQIVDRRTHRKIHFKNMLLYCKFPNIDVFNLIINYPRKY